MHRGGCISLHHYLCLVVLWPSTYRNAFLPNCKAIMAIATIFFMKCFCPGSWFHLFCAHCPCFSVFALRPLWYLQLMVGLELMATVSETHFHIPHIGSAWKTFSTYFPVGYCLRAAIFVLIEVSSCISAELSGIKNRHKVRLFFLKLSNVIYCLSQDQWLKNLGCQAVLGHVHPGQLTGPERLTSRPLLPPGLCVNLRSILSWASKEFWGGVR